MAIVGIGTDILDIPRIEGSYQRFGQKFVDRILSAEEQKSAGFQSHPERYLAKRFAAKEALMKALGRGLADKLRFDNFSVLNDSAGKPYVVVSGRAQEVKESLGITELHISLSDEKHQVIAFAIAEK
ncbi:holo-ACP synthase [Pleionea sp. CnH1-48]|uniref:holo-ACP synthase n=1 Tax=Pleionea sp. CnH1-48 TaxID=2954494 RepID=UPI002097100A|nr:holo-ACP synthase [Pleionea sp. CnH1-48]MCO7225462.1 holo-ACP synthase [Pleionea sp. CnH1-48]